MQIPREMTLHRLEWPDWIEYLDGTRVYVIDPDNPVFDPIRKGDGVLGWEGDMRMAFALNPTFGTWDLIRYEGHGHYMRLCGFRAEALRWPEVVGMTVVWLLEHDRNRGFDPVKETIEHNRRLVEQRRREYAEQMNEEVLPHLAHAMQRDGADIGLVLPKSFPDLPWKDADAAPAPEPPASAGEAA